MSKPDTKTETKTETKVVPKIETKVETKEAPKPIVRTGFDLYSRFALAGAVCCSVTHAAVCPIDVVKTRIQLSPEIYNSGMLGGFRQVIKNEGALALLTGIGPTAVGYAFQGALKFGGYEFWKKSFINYLGVEKATNNRTLVYTAASGIAEFFADVALCPLEAVRIRLVSQPDFAKSLPSAAARLLKESGVIKGFYSGFIPMLFKQIPYTMAKFVVYERVAEAMYASMKTPKDKVSASTATAINLGSGLIAGLCAAVISQPADTLLSKMNKAKAADGQGILSRLAEQARLLGFSGLMTGLTARLFMVGTLTAAQFAIYGDIKRVLGAAGGVELQSKK